MDTQGFREAAGVAGFLQVPATLSQKTNKYRTIDLYGFEIQRRTSPGEIFHVSASDVERWGCIKRLCAVQRLYMKSRGLQRTACINVVTHRM